MEINNATKLLIISAFILSHTSCPSDGLMPYIPIWNEQCDATWDEGAEVLGGWDKIEALFAALPL